MPEEIADGVAQPLDGEPAAKVLVAGATGFAGALSAHLLWRHPRFELKAVTGRSEVGRRLDDVYPRYRVPLEIQPPDLDAIGALDAAIVGYPHGAAAPLVAELRGRGVRVVDLSADFRIRDPKIYRATYGEHVAPELMDEAVYGLPELYREQIRGADLVANPGCYPTASILALAPLVPRGLIEDVVIDAKSGVSGAGRGGGDATGFVNLDENAMPYKVEGHRHEPEIEQEVGHGVTFIPHLLPLDQGELVSCYVKTKKYMRQDELDAIFAQRHGDEPFVEIVKAPPGVRDVRDTNFCRIQAVARKDRVLVFAAIDNLWKGAAGQAVQNLNLMFGLDETTGLT